MKSASYLEKAGITKGNMYLIGIILTGGGYEHFNKGEEIASMNTQVALLAQQAGQDEKKLDELSKEVRALTRAVDRLPQDKAFTMIP